MQPVTAQEATVAVEVSALRDGPHDAAGFVEFVLGSLSDAGTYAATPWSLRRLGSAAATRHAVARSLSTRVAARAAAVGAAVSANWAAPPATLLHLAGGPRPLRVDAPAVISVHRPPGPDDGRGRQPRKAHDLLRRAADAGVVIHTVTDELADDLIERVGVDRNAIVIMHPGIRLPLEAVDGSSGSAASIDVLSGASPALDVAIVNSINASGVASATLRDADDPLQGRCVVVAAPGPGFPTRALEALAAGVPVVTARTPTTASLLAGAVRFIDDGSVADAVDAAVDLATNEMERRIAVAAGRARALDFEWHARRTGLLELYRRASLRT